MNNNKRKRNIKYLNKDFNSFKNSLIEFSKTYFPNTYNDFSEASTGMLYIEMASYLGDILSFYLDNQIQETFIQHSRQIKNIFSLAYFLGYEPKVTTPAQTIISIYQVVPATQDLTPDYSYSLYIPEYTKVSSDLNSTTFMLESSVDFSYSSSFDPTEVSKLDVTESGEPVTFLLKKNRKATSSTIKSIDFNFTSPKKFDTRIIEDNNIIGILDITDSEGNKWYEVPNIAQETIFDSIKNNSYTNPNFDNNQYIPDILQLKQIQNRFVTRFLDQTHLQIQFGAGNVTDNDEEIIPNPDNVGIGLPFSKTKLSTAYSPTNFMFTNTYGIAPSNTTLTVRYLVGGGINSNLPSGTLNNLDTTNVSFVNPNISSQYIFDSLKCTNLSAASGGSNGDSLEEIKFKALNNFQNQLRVVTKQDYLIRSLSLPSNFGQISKAYIDSPKYYEETNNKNILDLYILSYDSDKKLIPAPELLKQNLKTYLSEYRMINDSIKIKDAFIINIGINFDIITYPNYNSNEVLFNCIKSLKEYFDIDKWQINEPILLKDINILLDKVEGVQTVKDIQIINKFNSTLGYSDFSYDIQGATLDNVIYPSLDPMIFEVKYPDIDIKGRVVSY